MKQTGLIVQVEIMGATRTAEYRDGRLYIESVTLPEAHTLLTILEAQTPAEAMKAFSVIRSLVEDGATVSLKPTASAPVRGVDREPITPKPGSEAPPAASAASAPTSEAASPPAASTTPPAAPEPPPVPAARKATRTGGGKATNGVNGAAKHAPEADTAPTRPDLAGLPITAEDKEAYVKAGMKAKIVTSADIGSMDIAWAALVAKAPPGWFEEGWKATHVPGGKPLSTGPAKVDFGAPVFTAALTAEIKKAYGMGPALLGDLEKQRLVDRAVKSGTIEPRFAKDPVAAWAELGKKAPTGWFTKQVKAAPVEEPEEPEEGVIEDAEGEEQEEVEEEVDENGDPLGLAPEGEDVDGPIGNARPATENLDVPKMAKMAKLKDVLNEMVEGGITSLTQIIATCEALKSQVPVLERIAALDERVPRTLEVMGVAMSP